MGPINQSKKRKPNPPNDIFRYLEKRPPSQPLRKEGTAHQSVIKIEDDDDVIIIDPKSSRNLSSYQKKTNSPMLNSNKRINNFMPNPIKNGVTKQQPSNNVTPTCNGNTTPTERKSSDPSISTLVVPNTPTTPNSFFARKYASIQKQNQERESRNYPHSPRIIDDQQVPSSFHGSSPPDINCLSFNSYTTPTSTKIPGSGSKAKRLLQRFKPLDLDFNADSSSDCDSIANIHEANLKQSIVNSAKVRHPGCKTQNHLGHSLFSMPVKRRRSLNKAVTQFSGSETPRSRLSTNLTFKDRISSYCDQSFDAKDAALLTTQNSTSIITPPKDSVETSSDIMANKSSYQSPDMLPDNFGDITTNLVDVVDGIQVDSQKPRNDVSSDDFSSMGAAQSPRPPKFVEIDELPFSINNLNRWPDCPLRLKELSSNEGNLVLFETPLVDGIVPVPISSNFKNIEEDQVGKKVLLPCDSSNTIVTQDGNSIFKWDLILKELKDTKIGSIDHLEKVIKDLNPTYSEFNFNVLRDVLDSVSDKMTSEFLENLLPNIIELALSLEDIVTQPVPLLRQGVSKTLVLSQKQVACLMANAFLCLYPKRNSSLFKNYPDVNFWRLLSGSNSSKVEKLKCIINYFKRVTGTNPLGVISFTRRSLKQEDSVDWSDSRKPLSRVAISLDGRIEKEGRGMLQVDFANQMIGGGVLAHGCVQEEIMFAIFPEMIISRLFCERLLDYEVILISGAEQYNTYTGYADSFKWSGNFVDETPVDSWRRRMHRVVAMDAKMFTKSSHYNQFRPTYVDRELNKAYCGFKESRVMSRDEKVAVATGNWGCGVFGGDKQLKFLIQLLATSQAERDILYFTFGDKALRKHIQNMYDFFIERRATVAVLYNMITTYFQNVQKSSDSAPNLFDYIKSSYEKEGQLVEPATAMSNNSLEPEEEVSSESFKFDDDDLSLG